MKYVEHYSIFESKISDTISQNVLTEGGREFFLLIKKILGRSIERGLINSVYVDGRGMLVIEYRDLGVFEICNIIVNSGSVNFSNAYDCVEHDVRKLRKFINPPDDTVVKVRSNLSRDSRENRTHMHGAYISEINSYIIEYLLKNDNRGATFDINDIKNTIEYKEIIALGVKDETTDLMGKRLNMKFRINDSQSSVNVYQNGTIRGESPGDYSRSLSILKQYPPSYSIEEYQVQLRYVIWHYMRYLLNGIGITKHIKSLLTPGISSNNFVALFNDYLNKKIAENPEDASKYRHIMQMPIYKPDEFPDIMKKVVDFGIF